MSDEKPTPAPETPAAPAATQAAPAAAAKPAAPAAPAKPPAPPARSAEEIYAEPLVAGALAKIRPAALIGAKEFAGETTLFVDSSHIVEVCRAFKEDGFTYLVDLCGLDFSKYQGWTGERFGVVYTLYSFQKNARVRLRVTTEERVPVPSVCGVWKTANWMERETWDMYGIRFEGHPNLERILTWEGFNGHPLRKDFPIRGIDTGARIYPEVFGEGQGPMEGSTGKDPKDVNLYRGEWSSLGRSPIGRLSGGSDK